MFSNKNLVLLFRKKKRGISQYSLMMNINMISTAVIPPNNKVTPRGNILLAGNAIIRDMAIIISILFSKGIFIHLDLGAKLGKNGKALKEIERMRFGVEPNSDLYK
jgi:hypothetical protein